MADMPKRNGFKVGGGTSVARWCTDRRMRLTPWPRPGRLRTSFEYACNVYYVNSHRFHQVSLPIPRARGAFRLAASPLFSGEAACDRTINRRDDGVTVVRKRGHALTQGAHRKAAEIKREEDKRFYERLVNSGKHRKLSLTACIRKTVTALNAMLRANVKRQPAMQSPLD